MQKYVYNIRALMAIIILIVAYAAQAQIGYQVSLLNTATGEPRANESVSVTVKITDSKGNVICDEVKSETTNDFGVVSMSVGNSETFAEADWNNLPFFIEASVDGRLIGRSQLLSVPVAEHAKHTGTLTKEILMSKTWDRLRFDDTRAYLYYSDGSGIKYRFNYFIEGNFVILYNGYYVEYGPDTPTSNGLYIFNDIEGLLLPIRGVS